MLLYNSAVSGNCYKVRLIAAHLGIPLELRELSVFDRSDRADVLGDLNPALRVPTIILEDGRPLAESIRVEMGELRRHLLTLGLEYIDAYIEGRAAGERRTFGAALAAKTRGEMRLEPVRIVALNRRRRRRQRVGGNRRLLRFGQRCGRKTGSVAELLDRGDIEPALPVQHADQRGARVASPMSHADDALRRSAS